MLNIQRIQRKNRLICKKLYFKKINKFKIWFKLIKNYKINLNNKYKKKIINLIKISMLKYSKTIK